MLPKWTSNDVTDRAGVLTFALSINRMGYIWRETTNGDVGIDGQVEHVDKGGNCTGHVVAVQVKTGKSYILQGDAHEIIFYPKEKHINYWRAFPLPVILALVDPETSTMYWIDARRYLRSPMPKKDSVIKIPRNQILNDDSKERLFESAGPVGGRLLNVEEVLVELANNRSTDPGFQMSFFELFALGLIDIGTKLFFRISLCMEIAEYRAELHEVGVGVGSAEHDFVDQYIEFLVAQHLIHYDYSDYLTDRDERGLQPTFICPLSYRGRHVVGLMHRHEQRRVVHESIVGLVLPFQLNLPFRLEELEMMQERIKANAPPSG